MTLRPQWLSAFGMLLAASIAAHAQTENFPARPITIVVPFPPGGLTDVPARLAASMLQEKFTHGVVIENKTGGSGVVGAAYAARATPDGYTLFANSLADTQNLHYLPLTYSPIDDFATIGWIVDGPPLVLAINAELPYKTLAELLADAKANPNKLSFGTSGPASSPGITLAQLNTASQTQIQAVPYRGSGDAIAAVATGAIQGAFTFFSQAKPLVDSGKARPLAVAGPKRLEAWPDVPTMTELGLKIDQRGFVGLAAPAKTPKPIVALLNKSLNDVVQTAAFKKRMAELGMSPPPAAENTPENFDKFMRDEVARQGELAELSGQKLKK
ncbi:MAG: tripartite tricarboxylate transporter substrate binding protein [Alphaproteobacteria bacterium]|nr:tripartite tricarboxylate transporter substrate binding protein [Alphaproteobacteria bacterium]